MDIIHALHEANSKLNDVRNLLDVVMYSDPNIDQNSYEFKVARAFYDAICKAQDLL